MAAVAARAGDDRLSPPDDVGGVLRGSGREREDLDRRRRARGRGRLRGALPDRVLLARPGDHPTELMTCAVRGCVMEELPERATRRQAAEAPARHTESGPGSAARTPYLHGDPPYSSRPTTSPGRRVRPRHLAAAGAGGVPVPLPQAPRELEAPQTGRGDPGLRQRLREGRTDSTKRCWRGWSRARWRGIGNGRVMPPLPASVDEATKRWRGSVDLLGRYLDENIVFDVERHVMTRDLYADFSKWLKDSGHLAWSEQNFTARLQQHEEVVAASVEKKSKHRKSGSGGPARLSAAALWRSRSNTRRG